MTYLPELRDSLMRAAAREYDDAASARSRTRARSARRVRSLLGRGVGLFPVALGLSVPALVVIVALIALRPGAAPQRHPTSRPEESLIGILGVLRGPETAADRVFRADGPYDWNQAYVDLKPHVRYATTAPWGDRLFIFAPPINATRAPGVQAGPLTGAYHGLSLEGELVGMPRHPLMSRYSVNGKYQYSVPMPDPYIPLTAADVQAGRATFIWPGGQPYTPAAHASIEQLFGPKQQIAVVVPDGVTKVEFVLPRQPMAIVGAPVYPRVEHVTVRVHHNVAVAEINRKCCYMPAAQLSQLSLQGNETRQASGPMIWFGADGQVIKRIGDFAAAGRVISLPTPAPETAASRAAERDPSTRNPVSIMPAVGGPRTLLHVHFKVLLSGAGYGYQLVRVTGGPCQILGYDAGPTTGQHIDGISAGYQPNIVHGSTWNGPLILNSLETVPLCPGTYRISVSVVSHGVFGGYGPDASWRQSKPFGSTMFTIR
jgi:hypothetical protein